VARTFFLEIGLGGLLPMEGMLLALAILLFLPFRAAIYFLLMLTVWAGIRPIHALAICSGAANQNS
jgi:hypothetical protein